MNKEDAFDVWWNGMTGFHLNSEWCLSDIQHHSGTIHPERLTTWMKICWNAALEAAEDYNSVDVSKLRAKFS